MVDMIPQKNVVRPRPNIPTHSVFAEMQEKQRQQEEYRKQQEQWKATAEVRDLFLNKIEPDTKIKVRFLADYEGVMPIKVHNRYSQNPEERLFETVCYETYGIDCPYCLETLMDAGSKKTLEEKYCWPIFRFPTEAELKVGVTHGRFGFFFFKFTSASVVGLLTELYGDPDVCNETLLEHDFILGRKGKTMETTKYSVKEVARTKAMNTDSIRVPSREKMLELTTRAFNPKLYEIIEKAGLVDGDEYWTTNKGEDSEILVKAQGVPRVPKAQIPSAIRPVKNQEDDEEEEFTPESLRDMLEDEEE